MRRIATTLALSAWMGFLAVSGLRIAHDAGLLVGLAGDAGVSIVAAVMPSSPDLGLLPHEALAVVATLAALTIGFGMAIAGLNAPTAAGRRRAEPVAGAALAALLALYASSVFSASPLAAVFGAGPGFLVSVALTFGALLFDHLMEIDEDGVDDATFEAILKSIRAAERKASIENHRSAGFDKGETR